MATIRPAHLEDVRSISEVHVRSWQVAYRGSFPDDFLDGLTASIDDRIEWRTRALTRPRPRSTTLVVEANGRVVGFVDVAPSRDDEPEDGSVGEITAIYLDPMYWGKGLGRKLLGAGEERMAADGFSEATLWVLDENHRARRFYERAGWNTDGTAKHDRFGGHGITEVRYRKSLAPALGR